MREIIFRGKRIDNGEWVYGGYSKAVEDDGTLYVFVLDWCSTAKFTDEDTEFTGHRIKPRTLGQYSGLTDKDGKKIFEGDIVKYNHSEYIKPLLQVEWVTKYASYAFVDKWDFDQDHFFNETDCKDNIEIIGNIHDNPSLLK